MPGRPKIVFFYNTDWYLYNFRLPMARKLRELGVDVPMISPDGPYGPLLRQNGFSWQPLPLDRRSMNPLRELRLIIWLVRYLRHERPSAIHGFTLKCVIYGGLAARIARVPARIGSITGFGYTFTSQSVRARFLRPVIRALLRLALGGSGSRVIVQNAADQEILERCRIASPASIHLIAGSGVDCEAFAPCPTAHPHAATPLRVLLAARLLWGKGLTEYVEAARLLHSEGHSIQFLIAGMPDTGNPDSIPMETVELWAETDHIEWLGHADDMPALLRSVHVLVLPSYYGEGLPRSLVEGAACGLAIVTTAVPGCSDVVTHEHTGLIVPTHNAPAIAQAVRRLYEEPLLRQRLGTAARERALSRFSDKIVISQTLDVYRSIIPGLPANGTNTGNVSLDHETAES